MTKALDAATAACRIVLEIHHRRTAEDFARAAIRAALPAKPTKEMVAAIDDARGIEAYREIRAQILGDDA